MIPEAALATFTAALFSMMNPIGNVGVFAGMTADRPGDQTGRIAWTCAGAVAITLLIVAWSGPRLLWLGASGMGVVTRVMGLVLAAIAMGLLADGLKGLLPGLAG